MQAKTPAPLGIDHRDLDAGTALVRFTGRLMLGPQGAEVETLVRNLLLRGVQRIVFDFSGLTHIDSTGMGRCIASLNLVMQEGGKLHIAGATGQVRESFRVTQLDRVFRFYEDVPAAKAAME